jgi:hypothetical protein
MGYIPHVVMPTFKEDIYQQTPDQRPGGPRTSLGSYPLRYKTKDQPMPQAWVPWTYLGTLTTWSQTKNPSHILGALLGVFTAWSQTKNPNHLLGALSGVFTAWSQTKNPSHLLGALTRVFCHGTDCLVPDQEPQECTGGPRSRLGSLPSSRRMALAAALNLTLPLSKRGILKYTKLVTKVYKLCQRQWLGKNICCLFFRRNILNAENVLLNHVPDIVVSHLNVF